MTRAAAGKSKADMPLIGTRTARRATKTLDPLSAAMNAMTEAQFQRDVRTSLKARGYVVWVFPIMKRTVAGVPDLTFWHPNKPGRLYFWELKRERGRVRPEQVVAIAHLATVPGVDARIVRPSDWRALSEEL